MGFLIWMLTGILLGVAATLLTKNRDSGLYAATMSLGLMGGLFGGLAGTLADIGTMRSFTWLSLLPAGAGAILAIGAYLIARRPRYHG